MQFHVITLFPDLIQSYFQEGVVGQAITQSKLGLNLINPRSFTHDVHHTVDDKPYGGGDGMVMLGEPLKASLQKAKGPVVYLSPQGKRLDHLKVMSLAEQPDLTLICGRYAGLDQRFINKYVDEEVSIGDYVLSGGEAAAIVLIDSVARQIEGVLGHQQSAQEDSFALSGGLLEPPLFTRPQEFEGQGVPLFLKSGHHQKIAEAKTYLSLLVTAKKRPDLLAPQDAAKLKNAREWLRGLSAQEQEWLGFLEGEF